MGADDDAMFRRPGAPPPPSAPVTEPARRPRYPGSPPPPGTRPSVPAPPPRVRAEITLDDDTDDDAEEVEGGRRPLPLPFLVAGLVAVVVAVLAGVLLLRPTLGVGVPDQAAAPVPTASRSVPAVPSVPPIPSAPGTSTAGLPGPVVTDPRTTPTPDTDVTRSADALAVDELMAARARDVTRVRFRGQWVAQLAAKYFGVVDPLQTTASGSHTFLPADVLAEYRQLRQRFGDQVVLLLGTDHSPRITAPSGARVWVTSFTGRFRSEQEVQTWCERAYPSLSGRVLADHCVPRRFTP